MSVTMSVSNGIETFVFKSVLSHGDTGKSITAVASPETALTVAESTSAAAADTKDYAPARIAYPVAAELAYFAGPVDAGTAATNATNNPNHNLNNPFPAVHSPV